MVLKINGFLALKKLVTGKEHTHILYDVHPSHSNSHAPVKIDLREIINYCKFKIIFLRKKLVSKVW